MILGPVKRKDVALKAISMRKAGLPWSIIAQKLSYKARSLKQWAKDHGYEPQKVKASPENLAKAKELRAKGLCWKLVEREMGINWRTLYRAIAIQKRCTEGVEK